MQIIRELAAEGNPIAKIAFLTRLAESTVREILASLTRPDQESRACDDSSAGFETFLTRETMVPWETRGIAA